MSTLLIFANKPRWGDVRKRLLNRLTSLWWRRARSVEETRLLVSPGRDVISGEEKKQKKNKSKSARSCFMRPEHKKVNQTSLCHAEPGNLRARTYGTSARRGEWEIIPLFATHWQTAFALVQLQPESKLFWKNVSCQKKKGKGKEKKKSVFNLIFLICVSTKLPPCQA